MSLAGTTMEEPVVAAVIVAAGGSTRLGRAKQLVPWGGETLLSRAVRMATEARCIPFVVLGCNAEAIAGACDLSTCKIVVNPEWKQGMAGSIRIGVEAVRSIGADAAIVMTCDQPAVTAQHLRQLIEAGGGRRVIASSYPGRRGVPAYFPGDSFRALQALQGDSGARDLLQHALSINLPNGELDIDTEAQLEHARTLLLCPLR